MASKTLPYLLLFAAISAITSGQSTNRLNCYVCESRDTPACEDPANTAVIPSVDCSSLVYPAPKDGTERSIVSEVLAESDHGQFLGAPILAEVFRGSADERSSLPFRYICLKVTLTADGKNSTTRTCERLSNNIKDACDFIRHDTNPKFKVRSCGSCDTDNCNSAAFPNESDCDSDDCDSGSYLNASFLIVTLCIAIWSVLK